MKNKKKAEKHYQQFLLHQEKNNEILKKVSKKRQKFDKLENKLWRAQRNICKIKTLEKQLIELQYQKTQYQINNYVIQQDFYGQNIQLDKLRNKAIMLVQQNQKFEIILQKLNQSLLILAEQINELRNDILRCYVNPSKLFNILTHLIQNPYDFSIRILKVRFQEVKNKLEAIYYICQQKYDLNEEQDKIEFQIETNAKLISHYHNFIQNNNDQDRQLYYNLLDQQQQINAQKVSDLVLLINNIKSIPLLYQKIEKLGKQICDEFDLRVASIQCNMKKFQERNQQNRQTNLFQQNQVVQDLQVQQIVDQERETSDSPSNIEQYQQKLFIINEQAQQVKKYVMKNTFQYNTEVQINEQQQIQNPQQEQQSINYQEEHKEN